MRHVSNLHANATFSLQDDDPRAFVDFYYKKLNKVPGISPVKMPDLLWQTAFLLLCPNTKSTELQAKHLSKDTRKNFFNSKVGARSVLSRANSIKAFVFRAYVGSIGRHGVASLIREMLNAVSKSNPGFDLSQQEFATDGLPVDTYVEKNDILRRAFTGEQLAARLNVPQKAKDVIREAVTSVQYELVGEVYSLVWNFKISFAEAQYLNQSPVEDINNAVFYSFLIPWVHTGLATSTAEGTPPYCLPLRKIAESVNRTMADKSAIVQRRVGEHDIVINHLKDPLWIPSIDNTEKYETDLINFGTRSDGSYSHSTEGDANSTLRVGDPARKVLPKNIPLFTDWVNRRFAYVNSTGNVETLDLGLCTPLNLFHVRRLLETKVGFGVKGSPLTLALSIATTVDPNVVEEPDESKFNKYDYALLKGNLPADVSGFVAAYAKLMVDSGKRLPDYFIGAQVDLRLLSENSPIEAFRFFGRMLKKAEIAIQNNLEVVFRNYSVMSTLEAVAVLKMFNTYVDKYDEVKGKDNEARDAYLTQGLDPKYKQTPIPNFRAGQKFMPHQGRAANKMRRGPKFAVYDVDAGGGKTLMILYNVLQELRDKKCSRPIIACPAHLVKDYIKEAVYFTEGKVNVIPVTSVSLKQHGEEKLAHYIRKSPRNTIVVTDYNFIKGRKIEIAYGNKIITYFKNAEFLRSFEFDLIALDECHFLRAQSTRTKAVNSFVQEIPMKRIASGTIIADGLSDWAPQIGLLDPTIFGTPDQFRAQFAQEMKGGKVIAWKPDAPRLIKEVIQQHTVFVSHKRKEWAALLPWPEETFHGVELTANQRALYDTILKYTLEEIEKAIAKDARLKEMLESSDDSVMEELAAKIRPYLARLEAFLSNPSGDPAGKDFLLLPEDQVSPKIVETYKIIRDHLDRKLPGKILIFTNYTKTAESVYANAPPDLKKLMIHYKASTKVENAARFETDAGKQIMVGVSSSMEVGLNLQFCSRLIRIETVWTPGALEQGTARVMRPNPKVDVDPRDFVYFDWVIVNRSLDVTKVSRLISKSITKVKFDNAGVSKYDQLDMPPQIAMTLDNIAAHNDFEESLEPYLLSYEETKRYLQEDFKEFKEKNPEELKNVPIVSGGLLEGSALMTRVPYVPGMTVYGEKDLGLVRYDQFVGQDVKPIEDDEDDDSDDDSGDDEDAGDSTALIDKSIILAERAVVINQPCHTEFGDGVITKVGLRGGVEVTFPSGEKRRIRKMAVYIITRSTTNSKDMRDAMLKLVGDLPLTEPIEVPVEDGAANKKRKGQVAPPQEEPGKPSAEFDITIINDFLAISYRGADNDGPVRRRLANVGFTSSPQYVFSKLRGPKVLLALFQEWKAKGFKIDPKTNSVFIDIYSALKGNKLAMQNYGFATGFKLQNWLRMQVKPVVDPKFLSPYPIVQDQTLYIALPLQGHPGTRQAIKSRPMTIAWHQGGGDSEILRFVNTANEIVSVLKQVNDAGISIGNLDELKAQYEDLRQRRPRKAKD